MKDALKFWPVLCGLVAALMFGAKCVSEIQRHLDDDARRDERIRVLERVVVGEFPAYSPAIYVKE